MDEMLLEIEDLTIQYQTGSGLLTAVSDASFSVGRGEYFGLAGESGCGKSTISKAIMGILDDNGNIASGKIRYKGREIQDFTESRMNDELRWNEISFIPQSSRNSLDPLQRIDKQAAEIAKVNDTDHEEALEKLGDLFEIMELNRERIHDYPHQFSGGMQQRTIIALSLFLQPSLIIADEPTTAIDVIMQDQIFKYLERIQEEFETSMMLVTHDISLIFESCEKMAIMHGGQIAEQGSTSAVYELTRHPYSILLQNALPDHRYPNRELTEIKGTPPQSLDEVTRCTFSHRCPWAVDECEQNAPAQEAVDGNGNHKVACFRKDEVHKLYDAEGIPEQPLRAVNESPMEED